jgi:hypothetical protein
MACSVRRRRLWLAKFDWDRNVAKALGFSLERCADSALLGSRQRTGPKLERADLEPADAGQTRQSAL